MAVFSFLTDISSLGAERSSSSSNSTFANVELEASGRMAFVSADSMTGVTSCFRGGLLTLSRRLNETGKRRNYYKRKFIAKGKKLLEFLLENPIGNYKISPQIW
jgi:hypothetical protein